MGRVREIYDGKLVISGGVLESDIPGSGDLVGMTTYDTGRPDLPTTATVAEWQAVYEELFQAKLDPAWEKWGKPVYLTPSIRVEATAGRWPHMRTAKPPRWRVVPGLQIPALDRRFHVLGLPLY